VKIPHAEAQKEEEFTTEGKRRTRRSRREEGRGKGCFRQIIVIIIEK